MCLQFADDDSTPKMIENARVATVEAEVNANNMPSMKKAFVALEKIEIGREGDWNKLSMDSNGVNDADSPEIVEKTSIMREPRELEISVEEIADKEGIEEQSESSDEEDLEKLQEEADAATAYVLSWMSESSVQPKSLPAESSAAEEAEEETEEQTDSRVKGFQNEGAAEEVKNSNKETVFFF